MDDSCKEKRIILQEEAQNIVTVKVVHIREEAAQEMEIFGSSLFDDFLFAKNTTCQKKLKEYLKHPITDKNDVEDHYFSKNQGWPREEIEHLHLL